MTTTTDTAAIVKHITVDAPATKVFEALTDPSQRALWWTDDGHEIKSFDSDLRVGGKWHMHVLRPREHDMYGEYRIVDAPHALEFTWGNNWYGADWHETIVRFDLTEVDGKTHLRLTHSGFTDAERRENHDEGWDVVLGWLQRYCMK